MTGAVRHKVLLLGTLVLVVFLTFGVPPLMSRGKHLGLR